MAGADRPLESPDPTAWLRPPLADWALEFDPLRLRDGCPPVAQLERLREEARPVAGIARPRFTPQTASLLADGLHYEERIRGGLVATRENNWHDLLNALVWLRYPRIKTSLNSAQCADIAAIGPRERSRAQCAMTHFDEAGAVVLCSDPELMVLWDRHDWHGLFWREREAWGSRLVALVFGHAILELAIERDRLLTAKCIVLRASPLQVAGLVTGSIEARSEVDSRVAELIDRRIGLRDPQELRPLPLSGIPGWHEATGSESFYTEAPCFRPLREGRRYPLPERA